MRPRNDSSWLDVRHSGEGTFVIRDHGRLSQLISELPQPNHQYPLLSVFIGNKTKDVALQTIFPHNNIRRTRSKSIGCDNPILFADGDLNSSRDCNDPMPGVHDYSVTWNVDTTNDALKLVYARLVFLFADVVCIFADDFPDLASVAQFLIDCIESRSASTLPRAVRPRVLVVLADYADHAGQNSPPVESFYQKLHAAGPTHLSEPFSFINLVYLDLNHSEQARYNRLRMWLKIQSDDIRTVRSENWADWNLLHLNAFFRSALSQLSSDDQSPFNFVKASREANPVPAGLSNHILHYVEVGMRQGCSLETLLSTMVSALMLDHYVPDMMLMEPRAVLRTLYRPAFLRAFRDYRGPKLPKPGAVLISEVEQEFPSLDFRRCHLLSMSAELSQIQSDRICLYCLVRPAQHSQACGHTVCDLCPQLFGVPAGDAEYRFTMLMCLLCQSQATTVIDVLPPTMNPTVLAIDGGGVRGGIPLEYLLLIQESLGAECRLVDLVDVSVGSSSGGLLVLGLIGMEWDAPTCSQTFDLLARRIFRERRQPVISWLLRLVLGRDSLLGDIPKWLSWFLHDSCYDPRIFDVSLQEAFSGNRRVFDPVGEPSRSPVHSRSKFGVIAASIAKDTRSFVFGNFNASDWFCKDHGKSALFSAEGTPLKCSPIGYELFRAETRSTEPLMWEVARATAAAPFFFSTAHLRNIGSFQDGGLQDNFAAGIAGRLCRRIWPSKTGIARLISMGTGDASPPADRSPHFRHVFRDGFLRRGFDAFMSNLGTTSKWLQMVEQLDSAVRPDYIRLDVSLNDIPCTIDNAEAMDDYRNLVILQPGSARMAGEVATSLLIARFFFALESHIEIESTGAHVWCHGTIRCKGPIKAVVGALERLHPENVDFVSDSARLGTFSGNDDVCRACGRYSKSVSLLLRHPGEVVNIYMRINRHQKWRISGFPASAASITKIQQLQHAFGRSDHGRPNNMPCALCDGLASPFRGTRRKRASMVSIEEPGRKRVRVVDQAQVYTAEG
ncbi:patatin-like phospholipase family protein [Aspergillus alliaceus]|uniref:patatin-like phospholipase family protein n=1 Tax=Petromyces alliaceus TaxID=209559 RepID=UPI0012A68371|nr:patatin-like phospholipase [Aspergillus alliaceus]KAB8227271.1 patatin-like phospholipase [Aspergillus alliaceus]